MYFNKKYSTKPTGYEASIIQKSLKLTTIDIKTLAHGMSNGCTFKPAALSGTKSNDFVSQELFALDFDDNMTIDKALNKCERINLTPAFGYTTFSHKPDHHKFRLVFHSNKVINDVEVRNKIQLALMNAFSECDIKCKDPTRLFYGGKSLICLNENAIFNPDDVIAKYYVESTEPQKNKTVKVKTVSPKPKKTKLKKSSALEHEAKIKAISELDVATMKKLLNIKPIQIINPLDLDLATTKAKISETIAQINNSLKLDMDSTQNKIKAELSRISQDLQLNTLQNHNIRTDIDINADINLNLWNLSKIDVECKIDDKIQKINLAIGAQPSVLSPIGDIHPTNKEESSSISGGSIPLAYKMHIFKCQKDLYDYINNIDFCEYLGVGNNHFCCVLPGHDDSKPSAHIYTPKDGTPFYHCFGCNQTRTIINITENLSGCKRSEAIEFIKKVYDLQLVESDWTKEQKQILIDSANYLDTQEFKITFPTLSNLIRHRKIHIQKMMYHFTQYVNEDMQIDGSPIFFASYNTLLDVCGINKNSRKNLPQSLTLFVLLDMLEKLPEEKIPDAELRKAKSIAAQYGFKKITNFYKFEEYGFNKLSNSEDKAKLLKENGHRIGGCTREWVLRTLGKEEADRVFPQYKYENNKGTSEKSDERTLKIAKCILSCIDKKGYATEKDVVYMLSSEYRFETTETQIKISLQEILNTYELKKVKANKLLKEKYKIEGNGYPNIIIPIDTE